MPQKTRYRVHEGVPEPNEKKFRLKYKGMKFLFILIVAIIIAAICAGILQMPV